MSSPFLVYPRSGQFCCFLFYHGTTGSRLMLKRTTHQWMLGLATWGMLVQGEIQSKDLALSLQTHGEMLASQPCSAQIEQGWADENMGGHHVVIFHNSSRFGPAAEPAWSWLVARGDVLSQHSTHVASWIFLVKDWFTNPTGLPGV